MLVDIRRTHTVNRMHANEQIMGVPPECLAAILRAAPMPTAVTRVDDGRILFANPACREMLGRPEEELVGHTMGEVGFWTQSEQRAELLQRIACDGVIHDLEQRFTSRCGETRTVLATIAGVDLDGQPCLVGHIHDITERRALEAQLRESEARFRQVTETLQQGFLLRDIDPPAVCYASPAVARIFGVDLDTLYRDPLALQSLIHPQDVEQVVTRRAAMTEPSDFEYRILRPDGETRWIRTRAEPTRSENGRPTRLASVSEDVTAERELRDALCASEERFRLLAENSTDVIARLSGDQRIVYVSPASRTVYGHEPEEMVGRFPSDFVHPDDAAALRDALAAPSAADGVVTTTLRARHCSGEIAWVEVKIRAIRDPDSGEVLEFHTVGRDVSGRRRAEAEIRRAKEEAELANAAKSEFLSRMSHELRTPLHAILGFGELLEGEDLLAHQREELMQITRGGRHLLELINEVLDLSRIERGDLRLSVEPVHVGTIVVQALELLEPLADARAVTLPAAAAEDNDVHVCADRQRLTQVLLNLLSNAVKYNCEGGSVRVRTTVGDGPTARIEVADTGIGIAAEDLSRVFAPFERIGAETTEVEGTGLGLALTKHLMEAMGGTVGVTSEIGRGTTFWLDLPVAEAPAAPPAAQAAAAPPDDGAPVRTEPRSVLYIEDNPSNIQLVEAILRHRPEVTLLVAQQGSLGLDLARERQPDLVLLDLNLPDVSGDEVLRRLRSDPRTRDLTIVILSADATPGQVARLRSAGADGYLAKPFDIQHFLAIVDGEAVPTPDVAAPPPPAPTAPAAAIDVTLLDRLRVVYREGDALAEFVHEFLTDSAERLKALVAAVDAGDAAAVRWVAHAWRGACGLTGAVHLAAALSDVETLGRVGVVPDAEELAAVVRAYDEASTALREMFG
jgi:PAS domain S-box-containing protein